MHFGARQRFIHTCLARSFLPVAATGDPKTYMSYRCRTAFFVRQVGLRYSSPSATAGVIVTPRDGAVSQAWMVRAGGRDRIRRAAATDTADLKEAVHKLTDMVKDISKKMTTPAGSMMSMDRGKVL